MTPKEQALAETRTGTLEGDFQNGLYVFKGIPYAAPPTGGLRWHPPQPVKPWDRVRPAKKFGPIAPQNPMMGRIMQGFNSKWPQDEDCLFLNIWTPGLDNARRPVMFWIHGGAFNTGSGSQPTYNGTSLAKRGDIVVVTINYRLGGLGFIRLREITGGKIPSTGNEGLMDQVAALEWVRDNIAGFGGDPGNVTVFGESAGAMSIGCLLAMPSATGLFHKAILESGVGKESIPLIQVATADSAIEIADQFIRILGIDIGNIEALKRITLDRILSADMELRSYNPSPVEDIRSTVTTPVIDGKIIKAFPVEAMKQGFSGNIPLLVGTNLEECKLFGIMQPGIAKLDGPGIEKRLKSFIDPAHVSDLLNIYRETRKKRGDSIEPYDLFISILTDITFRMPAIQLIEAQRNYQPVYNYLFTWTSPLLDGILGACHILDTGFVFGTYDDKFFGSGPDADKLSICMQDAWTAFARIGDPSCESLGKWPQYGDRRMTMILGKDCRVEEAPYDEERKAWESM